ncbi:N-6 DNA methylase [Staphylococcus aureus]
MLGDAYEFLIGRFAATAVKKQASSIHHNKYLRYWRRLSADGKDKLRHVYDPTCGSGSLLLRVGKKRKCIVISDKNVTILHTT